VAKRVGGKFLKKKKNQIASPKKKNEKKIKILNLKIIKK
jgi:hypothetical protein